jgi:hypothetical protein
MASAPDLEDFAHSLVLSVYQDANKANGLGGISRDNPQFRRMNFAGVPGGAFHGFRGIIEPSGL